uniref:Poly(A) RNA polymerase mitochondrial-like central palm domain-containing protein n=1 Tax=Oryza meridionalis TaxID=40149 RepID=A0A0E0EP18_9ORYZ
MAAAASPPVPSKVDASSRPDRSPRPQSLEISWDSQALCKRAESCELEAEALSIDPTLLPVLDDLLIELYAILRPKPDDYEQRHLMIDVFNKIAEEIYGKKKGFPVVEAFGSFTMDLFTSKSDLDLSVNFNADFGSQFARKDKISVIRNLAKMKFWAKAHDVNCPRDRTMSSMAIISLVAFHLQTRRPPILPAFSALLKDGPDFPSIQRNVSLVEGFGSRNKESVAELFVSLMSKLLSVEGLWEQGLCVSNFEGSWIFKTWERGVGNLSIEDFLDRSQNFARAVGKEEMQRISECIRVAVLNLNNFFRGKIDAPKLKNLLFEPLRQDELISNPSLKRPKRKDHPTHGPESNPQQQKKAKHIIGPESNQKQQKKVKHTVNPGPAASRSATNLHRPTAFVPQIQPIQPINQVAHIPQPLVDLMFAYGLPPQQHLHSAPLYSQGLLGQQQGNFIHLNPGIQPQQQAQHMFVPLLEQQPVINGFHPYDFHLAQLIQHNENIALQRMAYGTYPYYRR